MKIAKILFLIITGAVLLGSCDDGGSKAAYNRLEVYKSEVAQRKRDKREAEARAKARAKASAARAAARATESKVFLACETEGIWDTLTKANIAGHNAFANKVREFIAIGLCIWIPKSAKCVITDTDIWSGVNEIYVNDRGPVYAQNTSSCNRRY